MTETNTFRDHLRYILGEYGEDEEKATIKEVRRCLDEHFPAPSFTYTEPSKEPEFYVKLSDFQELRHKLSFLQVEVATLRNLRSEVANLRNELDRLKMGQPQIGAPWPQPRFQPFGPFGNPPATGPTLTSGQTYSGFTTYGESSTGQSC